MTEGTDSVTNTERQDIQDDEQEFLVIENDKIDE